MLDDPSTAKGLGRATFGVFTPGGRDVVVTGADGNVRIYRSAPWKDQPKAAAKKGP